MATEFSCQGLELDFPIVCWGNDFTWDGVWKSPPAKRSKAKDPHQLRVNSYRVLLTRGRDGFIVFMPNEIGMRSTYEALKGAGVREMSKESDLLLGYAISTFKKIQLLTILNFLVSFVDYILIVFLERISFIFL